MARFTMNAILTEEQLSKIDNAALAILEKVGILVPHSGVLEILGAKKGVRANGQVVRFDPKVVQDQIRPVKGCPGYDTHVIAGGYSNNYLDPDTDQIRPPTQDDLIKCIKQGDALGMGVCAPVVPLDIPGPRHEIVMEKLTHEYSRFSYGGGQATNVVSAEAMLEMSRVVNRPHGLEMWVNSPLKLDGKGLDIIWQLRHLKPSIRIMNMPVRGMTAPIFTSGLLAQSTAECFGAVAALRLLDIAEEVTYRVDAFGGYSVNMRAGNVLVCGPDYLRLAILRAQIARRHGIPVPAAKAFHTQAQKPGIQAAAEKTAQGLLMQMYGCDCYMAGGILCSDEVYSPVQLIVDKEIIDFIDATLRPIEFSEEGLNIDLFAEVGAGGSFLDHETTLEHLREAFWQPDIFSLNVLAAWIGEGSPSTLDKAKDVLDSLELRDEPVVSAETQKELERIEQRFAARL